MPPRCLWVVHHMGLPTRQPPVKQRAQKASAMSAVQTAAPEVQSGLEGVVAFATEIAEPDKAGGALRYRGVDIEDLVGAVPYEHVWGLLVDGRFKPGLPPAEPHPLTVRSGDPRVDVQVGLAMLAPEWGFNQLIDISDEQARENLARASVMALSFVAQSARGVGQPPVPQEEIDRAGSIPERSLGPLARRGRPQAREGDRRLLGLRRRARGQRLHVRRPHRRVHRRGCRRRAVCRGGSALGAPARGGALACAADARRGGRHRGRRPLGDRAAEPRRADHGLRTPDLPGRRPTRAGPASDRRAAGTRPRLQVAEAARAARPSAPWPSASPTACSPPTSSSGRP